MAKAEPVHHRYRAPLWLSLCASLCACDPATQKAETPPAPGVIEATKNGPAGAAPGTCWGRTVSPAVIESVKEQVQVAPAKINPDGTIATLPVYQTKAVQKIVTQRTDNWFETPCPATLTKEFNATLQRALAARGYYTGPINSKMDPATRAAIQAFQRLDGPDSGVLSLDTARKLGLIAVPRSPAE